MTGILLNTQESPEKEAIATGARPRIDRHSNKSAATRRVGTIAWSAAILAAAVCGLLAGLYLGYGLSGFPIASQPDPPSMSQCVTETINLMAGKIPVNAESLNEARGHCYSLIQSQGTLNDFALRKLDFFQQYRANGVLMWLVVAITFAGVALASLQLWASYKLAVANGAFLPENDSEVIVESNRLILRSSVTGLLILLISFCFFLVFVLYVYRFQIPAEQNSLVVPTGQTLPMGGLGPPPHQNPP